MGGTTKRVRRPNFEISVGEAKGGNTIFDSDLVGGGAPGGNYRSAHSGFAAQLLYDALHDLLVELYNTNWFKSGE